MNLHEILCGLAGHDNHRLPEPYTKGLKEEYQKWLHQRRLDKEPGLVHAPGWYPETADKERTPTYMVTGFSSCPTNKICLRCGRKDLAYDQALIKEMQDHQRIKKLTNEDDQLLFTHPSLFKTITTENKE